MSCLLYCSIILGFLFAFWELIENPKKIQPLLLLMQFIEFSYAYTHPFTLNFVVFQLGTGGVGYIWATSEGGHEEEWRHSVAPIPADKLAEITQAVNDDQELVTQDGTVLTPAGEFVSDTNSNVSLDDDNEDSKDDSVYFEKEVNYRLNRMLIVDI